MDDLVQLQEWFRSRCDGDWEHSSGIQIDSLDNPGWCLRVTLGDIPLEKQFLPIQRERSEDDWTHYRIENGTYVAYGGPSNLTEMIRDFLNWESGGPNGNH